MKKIYILLLILFIAGNLHAQVFWLNDLESAKSVAMESNKLIVMDFWASWCGPCKVMDEKLWKTAEMALISKNFVGVKINTDNDRAVAGTYSVVGIPKVLIATASGEVIWENAGFSGPEPYLSIMRAIPAMVGELNSSALALAKAKKDPKLNYDHGLAFQHIGKDIKNDNLKHSFLNSSESYFDKAKKLSKDTDFIDEVEMYSVLNDVYNGKSAKALKKMDKITAKSGNTKLEDFRHFVLAKCYQGTKDQDNFEKEKQLISNKDLIAQLE